MDGPGGCLSMVGFDLSMDYSGVRVSGEFLLAGLDY